MMTREQREKLRRKYPKWITVEYREDLIVEHIDCWCDGDEEESLRLARDLARADGRSWPPAS